MNLYLAIETASTLMEGDFEQVLGVYSTTDLAKEALMKCNSHFEEAEQRTENSWRYIFDGELSYYFEIEAVVVDKTRGVE